MFAPPRLHTNRTSFFIRIARISTTSLGCYLVDLASGLGPVQSDLPYHSGICELGKRDNALNAADFALLADLQPVCEGLEDCIKCKTAALDRLVKNNQECVKGMRLNPYKI